MREQIAHGSDNDRALRCYRRPMRLPATPTPAEIRGESPCSADSDCSVRNGSSCCGYFGHQQMMGTGPCGPMPPEASAYRAVCRLRTCVAVRNAN